jgi:hypothetical protein
MKILAALFSLAFFSASAQAQWQFGLGAGADCLRVSEHNPQEQEIVDERGCIPGVQASARYTQGAWRAELHGAWNIGNLHYDGQEQSGTPLSSQTGTHLARWQGLLAHPFWADSELLVGAEYDSWRRNIQGTAQIAGLLEDYSSRRWLLGIASPRWQWHAQSIQARVFWVHSEAENIHVNFGQQIYDPVQLQSHASDGARIDIAYQHQALPDWRLHLNWDRMRTPASTSFPLYKNQQLAGSVAEPEHSRTQIGLALEYLF